MDVAMNKAAGLVEAYYDSWKNRIASFDPTRADAILAEDLDFEGPIAGKRRGATPTQAPGQDQVETFISAAAGSAGSRVSRAGPSLSFCAPHLDPRAFQTEEGSVCRDVLLDPFPQRRVSGRPPELSLRARD